MPKKKNDIILISVLIVLAAAAFLAVRLYTGSPSNGDLTLEISINSETVYKENLKNIELPFTYKAETDNGSNTFLIDSLNDGSIYAECIEADCPDKICVNTGKISLAGDVIVCLPHRVTAALY